MTRTSRLAPRTLALTCALGALACGEGSVLPAEGGARDGGLISDAATTLDAAMADPDTGASTDTGPPPSCPTFGPAASLGHVAEPALIELSGLVESRANPGVLFVHNDNTTDLFAVLASDGTLLGHWTLSSAGVALGAGDVEDIAMGPMPDGSSGIYLGDIGGGSSVLRIARLPEPAVSLTGPPATGVLDAELMRVSNAFGLRIPNAESLLVDPLDGTIVIVQKDGAAHPCTVGVFAAGASVTPDCSAPAIAGIANPSGGDVSADGRFVIVRNETVAYVWVRPPGGTLIDAFGGLRCPFPTLEHVDECNGEAIGFAADGLGVFTASERGGCAANHVHDYSFSP